MSQYDAFYTSKAYGNTFLRKSLCIGDLFVFSTINFFFAIWREKTLDFRRSNYIIRVFASCVQL